MATSERGASASKRRRADTQSATQQTQRRRLADAQIDTNLYDPDQDPGERRNIKRNYRDLHAKLNDSRSEFLQPGSKGLQDTLAAADDYFKNVKQTADATIDSRLLVGAADLAYRKVNTLALGDSSDGIDVDDFLTKCKTFMDRAVRDESATLTQRQRDDEDDEDSGDTLNWEYLGRNACVLYNSRPMVTSFLLGPLSVEKKVRQYSTQRRAREERAEPTNRSRTLQLTEEELDNQERQSLTQICGEISELLASTTAAGMASLNEEYDALTETPSDDEVVELMRKHNVTDNGGVPLFNFCINPRSFGQSVENMFYVSFLIKEGKAGLDYDGNGLPALVPANADRPLSERQQRDRSQTIFALSYEVWEDLTKSFSIDQSIIPHREDLVYEDGVIRDGPEPRVNDDSDMYD
jgi:non-structural maintenance of chromosomes element 4